MKVSIVQLQVFKCDPKYYSLWPIDTIHENNN